PAPPDEAGADRHPESREHGLRARDRAALAMLLGRDARIGARRVDEREQREVMPPGELHNAHRLPVALRIRHPEVPLSALLEVATLLMADERHRPIAKPSDARDERLVIGSAPGAAHAH